MSERFFATKKQVEDGNWYVSVRERLPDEANATNRIRVLDGAMFRSEGSALAWLSARGFSQPDSQ